MLTFLSPLAGFAALAALVPLAAAVLGHARAERVRRLLRLEGRAPGRSGIALVAAVPLLLALAATQPAVARHTGARVRTDAAVYVVLDVSRSMLASHGRAGPTRLAQARAEAADVRAALPGVKTGIATLTDRVLPLLFPTADRAVFDSTLRSAVRIEAPPPLEIAPNATTFAALPALATDGFFDRSSRHRAVLLLTDGESQPFDAAAVAGSFGASLVVDRIGGARDRVFAGNGLEQTYRPDTAAAATLVAQLAAATGGRVVNGASSAAAALRRDLGAGPTRGAPGGRTVTPLAPYVALVALLPLGLVLRRRTLAAL